MNILTLQVKLQVMSSTIHLLKYINTSNLQMRAFQLWMIINIIACFGKSIVESTKKFKIIWNFPNDFIASNHH